MIFGSYPCCGAALTIAMPEKTPAYLPEACPSCGAKVWHVLSRIDPISYVEAEFLELFDIDEAAKTIKPKDLGPDPAAVLAAETPITKDCAEELLVEGCPLGIARTIIAACVTAGLDPNTHATAAWLRMRHQLDQAHIARVLYGTGPQIVLDEKPVGLLGNAKRP